MASNASSIQPREAARSVRRCAGVDWENVAGAADIRKIVAVGRRLCNGEMLCDVRSVELCRPDAPSQLLLLAALRDQSTELHHGLNRRAGAAPRVVHLFEVLGVAARQNHLAETIAV